MRWTALILLSLMTMAPACLAQDDDSFVQHVRTPEEIQYDNWLKAQDAKPKENAQGESGDPGIDRFAKDYFYAYRSGDIGELRMLVSPESLSCLDAGAGNYFKEELGRSSHTGKIDTLRWKDVNEESLLSGDGNSQGGRSGDRRIEISWREDSATVRHDVTLTESNGHYYQNVDCGSPGGAQGGESLFPSGSQPGMNPPQGNSLIPPSATWLR